MSAEIAFRRLVAARVTLMFDDESLGRRITSLIPVEVEECVAISSDGTHLMFNPGYIQTAGRANIQALLKKIAVALPDSACAPREAFAPWTGTLIDGVLRVDEPSAATLTSLKRLDDFLRRMSNWNADLPLRQS